MSATMAVEGFAAVPNWMIRDESITLYAITVYAALASHSGPGGIHPGQDTLAREARCSDRQVRRALAELEGLGVVERVRRKSRQGRASNGYLLHPNGPMSVDEVPDQVEDSQSATAEVPDSGDGGTGLGVLVVPLTEEEPIEEEPVVPRKRGTRIPQPFVVTPGMVAWAREHAPLVDGPRSTQRFENYWLSKTGKDATKLDWERTWRNWLLKDQEEAERRGGAKRTTVETGRAAADILAQRRGEQHVDERKAVSA